MKNLFCRMLWLDPANFELRHPKDQSSIIKFGFAISMIVMIELFSGNYIAKSIFQISTPMSYVAAFMWAWVIYVTDVLIIRSPGKKFASAVRIIIGIIIAVIGFFTVDSLLFKKEIDAQLRENAKTQVANSYDIEIQNQKKDISFRDEDYRSKLRIANEEAEGGSRTGKIGVGVVYRVKKETANAAQQELFGSKQKLNKLESDKENAVLKASANAVKESGFSDQIKAHLQYISNDSISLIIGAIFATLLLAIQCQVLLLKWSVGSLIEDQVNEAKGTEIEIDIGRKMKIDASGLKMEGGILKPASDIYINNFG